MATYICRAPEGLLGTHIKAQLAAAITDNHAAVTGGGTTFVQVLFRSFALEDCYVGGKPLSGPHVFIEGHIRAGRSTLERAAFVKLTLPAVSELLGVPRYAIWIYLSELPSRAMAEFGHMLPDPGDDAAWLAALPEEDREHLNRL